MLYKSDFLSPIEDICTQLQIDVTMLSLLFCCFFQLKNKARDVCSTVCIDKPDYVYNKRFVYIPSISRHLIYETKLRKENKLNSFPNKS